MNNNTNILECNKRTLPSSGKITCGNVRSELGLNGTISLGSAEVRSLACKPNGIIKMSDLYGKSKAPLTITVTKTNEYNYNQSPSTLKVTESKYGFNYSGDIPRVKLELVYGPYGSSSEPTLNNPLPDGATITSYPFTSKIYDDGTQYYIEIAGAFVTRPFLKYKTRKVKHKATYTGNISR